MIKNIYVGPGLQTVSSVAPYINNNGPCAGQVRYNTVNQNLEVSDGYTWISITQPDASISFDNEVQELLHWARKKKLEETQFAALVEKHPGIKELKEKLDMLTILVREEETA
jgi:hypothetical protein